jgi:hypothetical protein
MTRTFNDVLSMLEIWFFDESRMIPGFTSLTHDGKDHSLCTRLQAVDLIACSTQMARRYQIHGIFNIYVDFILEMTRDIFYWCLEVDTTSTTLLYRFTSGTTRKFTKGARSHNPSA